MQLCAIVFLSRKTFALAIPLISAKLRAHLLQYYIAAPPRSNQTQAVVQTIGPASKIHWPPLFTLASGMTPGLEFAGWLLGICMNRLGPAVGAVQVVQGGAHGGHAAALHQAGPAGCAGAARPHPHQHSPLLQLLWQPCVWAPAVPGVHHAPARHVPRSPRLQGAPASRA